MFNRNGILSVPLRQLLTRLELPLKRKPTCRNVSPSKVRSAGTYIGLRGSSSTSSRAWLPPPPTTAAAPPGAAAATRQRHARQLAGAPVWMQRPAVGGVPNVQAAASVCPAHAAMAAWRKLNPCPGWPPPGCCPPGGCPPLLTATAEPALRRGCRPTATMSASSAFQLAAVIEMSRRLTRSGGNTRA